MYGFSLSLNLAQIFAFPSKETKKGKEKVEILVQQQPTSLVSFGPLALKTMNPKNSFKKSISSSLYQINRSNSQGIDILMTRIVSDINFKDGSLQYSGYSMKKILLRARPLCVCPTFPLE